MANEDFAERKARVMNNLLHLQRIITELPERPLGREIKNMDRSLNSLVRKVNRLAAPVAGENDS